MQGAIRLRATSLLYTTHAGLACKSAIEKERKKRAARAAFLLFPSSLLPILVCCSVLLLLFLLLFAPPHAIASFRAFARLATSFIRRTTAKTTKHIPKSTMTNEAAAAAAASVRFLCPLCLGTLHARSVLMDAPVGVQHTRHTVHS